MSSLDNISSEAIQCLSFVDSFAKKGGELGSSIQWDCLDNWITCRIHGLANVVGGHKPGLYSCPHNLPSEWREGGEKVGTRVGGAFGNHL